MFGAASSTAAVYQFTWTGAVRQVEGDAPGNDIIVGDAISATFGFDTADAVEAFTGPAPGGGTSRHYDASLINYRFSVGSFLVSAPLKRGTLNYTDNQFSQDFIAFLTQESGPGPFGSIVANGQLIAQGPGSILPSASIDNGFPYSSFPIHRLSFGFTNGVVSKRVTADLTVTVTAIPEPASWALLVLGFACAGTALRHRRLTDPRLA